MSRPAKRTVAGPGRVGVAPQVGIKTSARGDEASRPSGRSSGRPAARPGRSYWLVAGDARAGLSPLVVRLDYGLRVLPVFGFEEEARLFSRRAGGNIRRIEPCRLVSLLRGPLRNVERLALDPLSDAPADLLDEAASLSRQRFLCSLLGAGSTAGRGAVDGRRGASERGSP